jgi:NAD(P)-dependent dehydrogenase (short-subunit alcohol dehydrogenase family)
MQIKDRVIVVTGGASGIGKAMAERFHREGARAVVVADRDAARAQSVAAGIGGHHFACDVTREDDIIGIVEKTEANLGPIGLFCSNAGIANLASGDNVAAAPDEKWMLGWTVHVMAHVYAARALLPRMIARGGGYFLNTVSAAGLLNSVGDAVYGTTKHAAVGFAENLAITHYDQGIRVSILCPQAVDTPMLRSIERPGSARADGVMTAEEVAGVVVAGLAAETFLILPHEQVRTYIRRKGEDYERWIAGMVRFQRKRMGKE